MFRQRVAPLVDVACKPKYVFLQRAKRPTGTSLVLQCCTRLVSSGFPCKVA